MLSLTLFMFILLLMLYNIMIVLCIRFVPTCPIRMACQRAMTPIIYYIITNYMTPRDIKCIIYV